MITALKLTIAKLELKQLELIDRLSQKHDDYVIRFIESTITDKFVTVNGDWSLVTGFSEEYCTGLGWENIIPNYDLNNVLNQVDKIKKNDSEFDSFTSDLIKKDGKVIKVTWKGKYFPEINGLVFIGRVCRY
jgi:PAS domain S-box-containing protein